MRVLMLVQRPEARGPVAKHTTHLVEGLRGLGCDVTTSWWGQQAEDESLAWKMWRRAGDLRRLRRLADERRFDVIVIKTAHDWRTLARDIPAAWLIRRRRTPVVLQFHGSRSTALASPGDRAFKAATRSLLALADAVLVLSTEERAQWEGFAPDTHVDVVKNPYVRMFGDAAEARAASREILFVGRLLPEKGVFDVVNAAVELDGRHDWRLVIAGDGPAEGALRRLVVERGLGDRVELAGFLSGTELQARYRSAAVFALPTSWDEGFPTVLAEAMDAGLPIVTTATRGAADHLVEAQNALFVEGHDVPGIAAALDTLLADADLRRRMGDANRKRVADFAPDAVAAEYLDVLEAVVSRAAARRD